MKKLSIEEVKSYFENKSYFIRENFIDEYEFDDNYYDYYKNFILNFNHKKRNFNYVSDIVDLALYLEVFDEHLYLQYKDMLNQNFHEVIKLSIIAYLEKRHSKIKDTTLETLFLQILKDKIHIILKNQILVSLFYLTENQDYFNLLLLSLSKTDDWRSIHRVLDYLLNHPIKKELLLIILDNIKKNHSEKNFGKGVSELLLELEQTH